jgi:uncharacterized protein (TIGR01244 family)
MNELLAVTLAAGLSALAQAEKTPKLHRVSEEISTAGQPSDEELEQIRDAGFKTVLNLRPPEEGSLAEKPKVEALGMTYVNIPITPETITEEKVQRFSEIVADPANKPLLIHCASGNRVGGLWFIHRALGQGVPAEQGLEEARAIGLKSPVLERIVLEYVEERKGKPK